MRYFRDIRFETVRLFEELVLLVKHPTREATRRDIAYHWYRLCNDVYGHPWYCLKRGVTNLIKWFPLIWKNDVFDHCYLLDVVDKQLDEMEKFWYSDNPHVMKKEQVAKRITWTRKLLKMYRDEYYTMKAYDTYKEKYPGDMFRDSEPCDVDDFGVVLTYRCTPTMKDNEREFYRGLMDPAQVKDEKVFKLFISNFSRLRNWWD